tara:strand:- start:250 stop:612 length:363 start_codon:yes stop_codon:yes gene_type:complete
MHSFKSFLQEKSKNENIGNVIGAIGKAAAPALKGIGKHVFKNKGKYGLGGAGAAAGKQILKHKDLLKKVAIGTAGAYAAKKTYDAMKNRKTGSGGTNFPKNQERIRQMQKRYGHPGNTDA